MIGTFFAISILSSQLLSSRAQFPDVTFDDILELKVDIEELIQWAADHAPPDETGAWLMSTIVRLGFHDCVGGCDGCVNMDNPKNAGLQIAIDYLETLYNDDVSGAAWNTRMSRADFWALSATLAARLGADNQVRKLRNPEYEFIPAFEYYYGRKDCEEGGPTSSADNPFPEGHWDIEAISAYFADQFELTIYQTITLMGVHTLGKARIENLGFKGMWIENGAGPTKDILDNRLYIDIIDASNELQWVQEGLPEEDPSNWQWIYGNPDFRQQKGLMLNSDMALYRNMSLVDPDTGFTDVILNDIPINDVSKVLVEAYAADNEYWLTNFVQVFGKMLRAGYYRRPCQLKKLEGYIGANNPPN